MPNALTIQEVEMASEKFIYYIWYEDKFHFGEERDSFAISICLSKSEADTELLKRGRPSVSGSDGYEIVGPCNLLRDGRPDLIREVLMRLKNNLQGPVPIPSELW